MKNIFRFAGVVMLCFTLEGFIRPGFAGEGDTALTLKSLAFTHEGAIPRKYTCQGEDASPDLEWEDVPEAAVSLVLIADDPDAPDPAAPKMTWVHWVVYNIPPRTIGFVENFTSRNLPLGMERGINDWGRLGYGGPCPPIGRHRYYFKLYALDKVLEGIEHPTKEEILKAMKGHILAETVLMGTYQKSK